MTIYFGNLIGRNIKQFLGNANIFLESGIIVGPQTRNILSDESVRFVPVITPTPRFFPRLVLNVSVEHYTSHSPSIKIYVPGQILSAVMLSLRLIPLSSPTHYFGQARRLQAMAHLASHPGTPPKQVLLYISQQITKASSRFQCNNFRNESSPTGHLNVKN